MARDHRARDGIVDDDIYVMKKFNYLETFKREEFSATALQFVVDECGEKVTSTTSKNASKKRKTTSTTRKYDTLPIKNLIPNIKFVEKHHLNELSHPADWHRAFIPECPKKEDQNSSCIQKWCQFTNMNEPILILRGIKN